MRKYHPESKIEKLCSSLRELAFERGPEAKLPSTRELCQLFQTNQVTINHALNVLEAQNVVYRRRGSGIFVSPKLHRKAVCILLSATYFLDPGNSPFWGMLWGLLAQEAQLRTQHKNEYYTIHLLSPSHTGEEQLPEEVLAATDAGQIHAFIAVGVNEQIFNWLEEQNIPSISFAGPSEWLVAIDHAEMARLAVESLTQQGCTRIAIWKPSMALHREHTSKDDLHEQHQHIFSRLGLTYNPYFFWEGTRVDPHTGKIASFQEQGFQLAQALFSIPPSEWPDGLFIADDMMTDGVIAAFVRHQIPIGETIKIATHANRGSTVLFGYSDLLTLIEINPTEISQAMFHFLDLLFANQIPEQHMLVITPKVIQRT